MRVLRYPLCGVGRPPQRPPFPAPPVIASEPLVERAKQSRRGAFSLDCFATLAMTKPPTSLLTTDVTNKYVFLSANKRE
ncbi:MAG: hypothetical protein LBT00_14520 [Spirochaetaceae bacterium]|nr:hypothetical protein [Spirochaetaceae bacterium]